MLHPHTASQCIGRAKLQPATATRETGTHSSAHRAVDARALEQRHPDPVTPSEGG